MRTVKSAHTFSYISIQDLCVLYWVALQLFGLSTPYNMFFFHFILIGIVYREHIEWVFLNNLFARCNEFVLPRIMFVVHTFMELRGEMICYLLIFF